MKTLNLLLSLFFSLFFVSSSYGVNSNPNNNNWLDQYQDNSEINSLPADAVQTSLDQFLSLTPKKYKKATGKKLGFKNTLKLKAAQRMIKKNRAGDLSITHKFLRKQESSVSCTDAFKIQHLISREEPVWR